MSAGAFERNRNRIVLGVDDQEVNLRQLKALLMHAGYVFVSASTATDALRLVSRLTPRLILLDIRMPEVDGFEACRRLRRMPHLNPVPIAFLTAERTEDAVRTGLAAGGDDFILKPFDHLKLLDRVKYWCARRAPERSAAATGATQREIDAIMAAPAPPPDDRG